MPPTLARIRRALGRLGADEEVRGEVQDLAVVPLTVRSRTADGADIRLLIEARMTSAARRPASELERIALGVVVPAAEQWVRRHELAALEAKLEAEAEAGLAAGPALHEVAAASCLQVSALGAQLIAVNLISGEHLLVSPSTEVIDGPR